MPDIAFFDLPTYARVTTTIALVHELSLQGEKIDYYCLEQLHEQVNTAGANLQKLPPFKNAPEDSTLQQRTIEYSLDNIPILLEKLNNNRPKLLIFTSKCLWGAILADLLNLPTVCIHTNFLLPRHFFPTIPLLLLSYPLDKIYRNLRLFYRDQKLWQKLTQKYSLERIKTEDVFKWQSNCMNLRGDINIVYTSEQFQSQCSEFDRSYYFTGPCYEKRNFDPDISLRENENNSIIYISLGTIKFYNYKTSFYHKCLEAFKNSNFTVIMAVGETLDIQSFGEIPDNFIIKNYAPQLEILLSAKVFITHGGTNSTWEGLLNKVPLIVFPQGGDQYLIANRVEELGLGKWIKQKNISPMQLRKITEEVMQNKIIQQNLQQLSLSLQNAGGTQKAVEEILKFKHSLQ